MAQVPIGNNAFQILNPHAGWSYAKNNSLKFYMLSQSKISIYKCFKHNEKYYGC